VNTPECGAAYVNSQTACALIEMEGMKAENMQREFKGEAMAYDEKAFTDLITKYGIYSNAVVGELNVG